MVGGQPSDRVSTRRFNRRCLNQPVSQFVFWQSSDGAGIAGLSSPSRCRGCSCRLHRCPASAVVEAELPVYLDHLFKKKKLPPYL